MTNLPDEIVEEILSYGDVCVTQKYQGTLQQIKYHIKEFQYQQEKNKRSQWYRKPMSYYTLYILMKNNIKLHLGRHIYTSKPSGLYNINCVYSENEINNNNLIESYQSSERSLLG